MTDFLTLNLFLLLLCAAGKLTAGRISRRLQYALWLLLPGYLLAARFVRLQGLAEVTAAMSPQLAHSMVKLGGKLIREMNAVRALVIESLTAGGIMGEMVRIWRTMRYGVTAVLVTGYALYNGGFVVRCIRRRRFYKTDARTGMRLYLLDFPQTPFLLGRSIYVHPDMAQDEEFLNHAVCHEYSHYRQGDFLWTPLRFLLFSYYWFDPVLWLAIKRMRQDSELACDERVVSFLGEAQRTGYGASLIALLQKGQKNKMFEMTARMGGRKSQLRERIIAISKPQKRSIAATGLVAACAVLAVCYVVISMTGALSEGTADAVFLWNGTGVERENIAKVTIYRFVEEVSYPPADITEEVLGGQGVPLTEPGRYMVIVTTKDHRRVEISDCGTDETAYSKGLLPSQVIRLDGD